jgi:hypothetical protein
MYGTLFCTIAFAVYTIFYALKPIMGPYLPAGVSQETHTIENFINVTTLIDFAFFLIGCLYFVAGSYPFTHVNSDVKHSDIVMSSSSKKSTSDAARAALEEA